MLPPLAHLIDAGVLLGDAQQRQDEIGRRVRLPGLQLLLRRLSQLGLPGGRRLERLEYLLDRHRGYRSGLHRGFQ
jgi:hypothetical protein